jgi:hypothetical protein
MKKTYSSRFYIQKTHPEIELSADYFQHPLPIDEEKRLFSAVVPLTMQQQASQNYKIQPVPFIELSTGDASKSSKGLEVSWKGLPNSSSCKIAILDTGFCAVLTQDVPPEQVTFKSFCEDLSTIDEDGHGTHIASLIHRLAPSCELMILKVLPD